ncbi:hypothetical protein AVEN_43108-1, partial [Araneus ventricosus]
SNPNKSRRILDTYTYKNMEQALGEEHQTLKKMLEMLTKQEYGSALLRHSNSFEKTTEIKFLKLMNQTMEFLTGRINFIERILIDDEDQIKGLMEWTQNQEMKHQSICLMRQRFLME